MQIGELLSVGLLVAGILSAIGAFINTRRKRAQKSSQPATKPAQVEGEKVAGAPGDLLAGLHAKEWRTRLTSVQALLRDVDDPGESVIFALLPLLNDPDSDVREAVIAGLVHSGATAVPGLMDTLANGDVNAREGAARALGKIGGKTATDALIEALADESAWVRIPAAQGLGLISAQKAVDPLIACLKDDDAGVRAAVKDALTAIGTRKALMAIANY